MSTIKIQATPTGTGVVTLTAPTTNVDRTVTMPDQTGTIYISGGDIGTPSAGNASNLTNLNASNLSTGTVPDARFPATLPAASGANLTALNASNLGSGTVPDARFPATLPATSGANLTNLNASNLASGTVGTARLASGTANSTTFLRGDQTWATPTASPPSNGAVGSVEWLLCSSTSSTIYNNTVSGSNLFYISSLNGATPQNSGITTGQANGLIPFGDRRNASSSFTAQTQNISNANPTYTNLSGTWRFVGFFRYPTFYDGYNNTTVMLAGSFIRIA